MVLYVLTTCYVALLDQKTPAAKRFLLACSIVAHQYNVYSHCLVGILI